MQLPTLPLLTTLLLTLLTTTTTATPWEPGLVLNPRDGHLCTMTGHCQCEFDDGSRCVSKTLHQECQCPDISDVDDMSARIKVKCILVEEFNDRTRCKKHP